MKFEDKREIWDAIIECAKHSPLTAPPKLAEQLLAAHSLVWGEEPEETVKGEGSNDDYPYETSNRIYELGNDLGYLARLKAEKRTLPTDASKVESALNELTKTIKALYGLNGDEGRRQPSVD